MNVKLRQKIEKAMVKQVVQSALTAGYQLTVIDGFFHGGEEVLTRSTITTKVLEAMFTTDEDTLVFFKDGEKNSIGWVQLVYGNTGFDVIHDYTTNLEGVLADANKLADDYEEKYHGRTD